MQFMNSILDKLVKNLSDEDFKYLVQEFSSENLEILKQKGACPYEYMRIILIDLMKKNYLQENISLVQQKKERLIMIVKYQVVT